MPRHRCGASCPTACVLFTIALRQDDLIGLWLPPFQRYENTDVIRLKKAEGATGNIL